VGVTTDTVRAASRAHHDIAITRELLTQMDEAKTSREHWKILITAGMGFFTDAYDLFIIGVAMS
jgi:MFS transporter, PHS family, inorganic phosphate transporter